jgi:hypothetical protein
MKPIHLQRSVWILFLVELFAVLLGLASLYLLKPDKMILLEIALFVLAFGCFLAFVFMIWLIVLKVRSDIGTVFFLKNFPISVISFLILPVYVFWILSQLH